MEKEKHYETPRVLKKIPIELEGDILAGSVVDSVSDVRTTGQDVGGFFDTSDATFNHSWGE